MGRNVEINSADASRGPQYEKFLGLLMANQQKIYAFILALVPNHSNADDILQETIIVMWRKFGGFEIGTNFTAWGVTIARFIIMRFRDKQRKSCVQFSEESIRAISNREEVFDGIDERLRALESCLSKLPDRDSKLIRMRYEGKNTIKSIAQKVGRPVQGMYKAMARIHNSLHQCVERTLSAWEMT